jgi:hypothetical protein
MDGSVCMVTSCKYLAVPYCVRGCDPFRLENRAAPFSEKKKKPKKSTDLIGTARYIPRDYCFGSKARIPLGLSNEILQNSSQTVPLDWPPRAVGIRLRRVPQQQLEGFKGELFHNSSWKSCCIHGLWCPRH